MTTTIRVAVALALLGLLIGILGGGGDRPVVVVYTSLDPVFSRSILSRFEEETGIEVREVFDTEATKTTGLVERIRRERSRPLCDVFWSNEPLRTIRLAEEGCFEPYLSPAATGIDGAHRDEAGLWTGFAARARVIAFDPERISGDALPSTLEQLLEPRFRGQVALADPRFGTTGSHLAALLSQWGEERYRAFLSGLRENEVQIVGGNSMSRDRVLSGECLLGLTDTDDVEVSRRAGDRIFETLLPEEGTLILPNTVALVAGAPHPREARLLIDHLLAPEREELLAASSSRQIPLRPGVPVPPGGLSLAEVRSAPVSLEDAAAALPDALRIAREILGL